MGSVDGLNGMQNQGIPLGQANVRSRHKRQRDGKALASDALPLPVGLTNKIFMVLFFSASYYLMRRWREKIRTSTPLHMLNLGEIAAIIAQLASFIYLIGFFGIDYVQNFISKGVDGSWDSDDFRQAGVNCQAEPCMPSTIKGPVLLKGKVLKEYRDEELSQAVTNGEAASHTLEADLEDCERAASVRRRAVELSTNRSLEGMPLTGMDYSKILGQCCEMVIGYVQLPVGVAGPLLLDGFEYTVPMATTEGCLVASTNRGCKAILQSGGAQSVVTRDGMTRAPVVRFESAKRAAELKWFLEDPNNFDTLSVVFNSMMAMLPLLRALLSVPSWYIPCVSQAAIFGLSCQGKVFKTCAAANFLRSSRFARLQDIYCVLAGRNAFLRFTCSTGDAMGMNMISKGVQNVLSYLQSLFPDMMNISISGNFCSDKKATAVNWIEGRGKSVVCEAVLKEEVVQKVLKTSVSALVQLNVIKNLAGSALAGAVGGFNAHAANIVSAVFIATGQDPAQNVESSQCMTMMEAVNDGRDLHVSVTMPSIEVGTIGGGTQLPSQAACLNLLGVKGAHPELPGANSEQLARVVAGAVLAGEISLMSALASNQLVQSHLKYNRSSQNIAGSLPPAVPQSAQSGSFRHRRTPSSKASSSDLTKLVG